MNTDERESDMNETDMDIRRTQRTATELEVLDQYAAIVGMTREGMDERLRYVNLDAIAGMSDVELTEEHGSAGPAAVLDAIELERWRRDRSAVSAVTKHAPTCNLCHTALTLARPNTAGWFGVYWCDTCKTVRDESGNRHPNAVKAEAILEADLTIEQNPGAVGDVRVPSPKERRHVHTEQLDGEFSAGRQSVVYVATFKIGRELVRFTIEADAYLRQSSAVADMFDPNARKWNEVARIHWSKIVASEWSYTRGVPGPEDAEATFYVDLETLIRRVCVIVSESR